MYQPRTLPLAPSVKRQLVWHRVEGHDKGLPAGLFSNMTKERMKELVAEALGRNEAMADNVAPCGERSKPSQTLVNDQMDTDAVLQSDESEVELELVDKLGLNLSDTKGTKHRPPPDLTHRHAPTPGSSSSSTFTPPIYQFGCKWDPINYSCSYNSVFMAFAWIYFHATSDWQMTWTGESMTMKTLSHAFKAILRALKGPANNPSIIASFSRGRDALRDILSGEDLVMFRHHGQVDASLTDILDSLSRSQTSSKYFSFGTSCGGSHCCLKVTTPTGAPSMLTPDTWNTITQSANPPHHESLQRWVSGYFNYKISLLPHRCLGCNQECSHTLSFLRPPWIWFEIFVEQPHVVLPSFKILLASDTYRLAAVLYGNAYHFVARLSTPSGIWWYYDGQVNGGQPVVDTIAHEEDLIACGDRYTMNALVYCPD